MEGFIRPKVVALPASAIVPPANLLQPVPNQFTHTVVAAQPFFFRDDHDRAKPDGALEAGASVVLMRRDGQDLCHVVDERGLYVVTAFSGLVRLA